MPAKPICLHETDLETRQMLPGAKARFVHSEHMTFAEWFFEPGTLLPEHAHHHEQITKLISGEFELTVNGEVLALRPGSTVVIPPHLTHAGKAVTRCHLIDAFHPVREDFRKAD